MYTFSNLFIDLNFFPVISHFFNKQAYTQRSYFVVFRLILRIKFPF